MHVFLAASWLDPIVHAIAAVITAINSVVHNRGWSLVVFALGFKLLFWPLNTKQFKSMMNMQKLAPQLKALQAKYGKSEPQRYQQETMELYKKHNANPLAGCWPMLVQYPVIISVYYAVLENRALYKKDHWLWIGSPLSQHMGPLVWGVHLLAPSLAAGDLVLLFLYACSMYVYSRFATMPSADPQQASTQKMMAIFSPLMLGFLGLRYNWPSAMVIYWLSYNLFTMGQQFYLLRKFHQPFSILDNEHAIVDTAAAAAPVNGRRDAASNSQNGKQQQLSGARKNAAKKKGARR